MLGPDIINNLNKRAGILRVGFALFIAVFICTQAWAEEKITNFSVAVKVEQNGDLIVTENISVISENKTIRRGIFRDLPRYLLTEDDYKLPQRYKILSVMRNGEKENFETEVDGNAKRLRIGREDVFLQPGTHTYQITYRIKDQVRRETDFDEIYWNVTGNYWRYEIDKANVVISLPASTHLQKSKGWTGGYGNKGQNYKFHQTGNDYVFETTRALAQNEGLTVSLQFDKGLIGPQQKGTRRLILWVRYGALGILTLTLGGLIFYYFSAWNKVGRDPVKDPLFARYEPPKGYSAAASGRVFERGSSNKLVVAALISLAIKKWIKIEKEGKTITLTRLNPVGTNTQLAQPTDDEKQLLESLMPRPASKVILQRKPNKAFYSAANRFSRKLNKTYGAPYYRPNSGYIVLGFVISIAALGLAVSQVYGPMQLIIGALAAALVILNVVFMFLMPAPTRKGQKVRREIEGFKLFMKTAEKQKLDAFDPNGNQPPPMSIKQYEALLPYAVALSVEDPWTRYFEKSLPIEAKNYNPIWTNVSARDFRSISGMTDNLVSSMNSGVSSARPQSSASSSSSGGGFSGGGGGGGGGGGW